VIRSELVRIERRLARFDHTISLIEWSLYAGRTARDSERWINARAQFLAPRSLRHWVERARTRCSNPLIVRRLDLLERLHLDAASEQHPSVVRLRSRLQRRIVRFRPRFRGKRVDRAGLHDELRKNPDGHAREEAYRAEDELWHAVEREFRTLIRVRNARARALGFRDYPELRLKFEGLGVAQLRRFCDESIAPLGPRIRRLREEHLTRTGDEEWYPWDLRYAQDQRAGLPWRPFPGRAMVPHVRSALKRWGLPMDQLPIKVTLHDIPFGGLTFGVRIPSDVRILIPPKGGWDWYSVGFHEFGHAVHFSLIRQPDLLLRSPDVGFSGYVEGIADLFEEVSVAPRWLRSRPGLTTAAVDGFKAGRILADLTQAASTTNWVATELDLYRRPDADLDPVCARRLRDLFGFGPFTPRSFLQTTYVTHPVYNQSYLLSLLFRKQLVRSIRQQVGDPLWPNPRVGPWLTENWFAPGAEYDWVPRVRQVTGRPFGPQAFLDYVRRAAP
jgi:peptidyl-dipeptidase A